MRSPECAHYSDCLEKASFFYKPIHCDGCESMERGEVETLDEFEEEMERIGVVVKKEEEKQMEEPAEYLKMGRTKVPALGGTTASSSNRQGCHPKHDLEEEKNGIRTCGGCGVPKPLEEYGKNPECRLGRESTCKKCKRKRKKENEAKKGGTAASRAVRSAPVNRDPFLKEENMITRLLVPIANRPRDVEELAIDHWRYVEQVLNVHAVKEDIEVIGYHYRSAFVHGFKHGRMKAEG